MNNSSNTSQQPQQPAKGRVLIVDDNSDNREIISYYLKKAGYEVSTELDGYLALKSVCGGTLEGCSIYPPPFDLVLMDMQMPRLDGYDTVRTLRSHGCRTPIIAVTAHTLTGDREKCLAAGCDDYLGKPIDREKLTAACAALIAKSRAARAA